MISNINQHQERQVVRQLSYYLYHCFITVGELSGTVRFDG